MKIKRIFEEGDFAGGGQMIVRNSSPVGSKNIGFMASVAYKIGYDIATRERKKIALTDGMASTYSSEQELCDALNLDDHGYRPMTRKECIAVAKEVGNRWPKQKEEI